MDGKKSLFAEDPASWAVLCQPNAGSHLVELIIRTVQIISWVEAAFTTNPWLYEASSWKGKGRWDGRFWGHVFSGFGCKSVWPLFFVEAAGNGLRRRTDKKLMRSKAQHVLRGSQEPENALSFGPNWCYREQGTGHGSRPTRRGLGVFWISEIPVGSLLTWDFWFWNLWGWENLVPSDPQRCVGIS